MIVAKRMRSIVQTTFGMILSCPNCKAISSIIYLHTYLRKKTHQSTFKVASAKFSSITNLYKCVHMYTHANKWSHKITISMSAIWCLVHTFCVFEPEISFIYLEKKSEDKSKFNNWWKFIVLFIFLFSLSFLLDSWPHLILSHKTNYRFSNMSGQVWPVMFSQREH